MGKDFPQAYHPVSQDNAYGPPAASNFVAKIIPSQPAGTTTPSLLRPVDSD